MESNTGEFMLSARDNCRAENGSDHDLSAANSEMIYRVFYSKAKLKAIAQTSALLAGFAMVAMVEVTLDNAVPYPSILLVLFSCVTTLLVIVHLFSLMIATCILPNIEAAVGIRKWSSSPHNKFKSQIEVAWILSTGFGLVLFLIEVALLIWIKFWTIMDHGSPSVEETTDDTPPTTIEPESDLPNNNPSHRGAMLAAIIASVAFLVPGGIAFVYFGASFYSKLANHAREIRMSEMDKIHEKRLLLDGEGIGEGRISNASLYSFKEWFSSVYLYFDLSTENETE
ncbi:Oidioi.mRNA.OKI2018_I69.XSR.g13303.t1.cds [Oikopleura dioica]|uniref:Oidioi.mRNA.OKI2018_I69.XSR.g13303.t1.cds n=1 Tax=Oikopleura dioica TaxID=34765 RepID=A0ABN7SB81_OIKDI|nr:Oidioi.mRNA.OKI2018_I69.XSR.g13303.t1.cds [Oikopleura dioica]